MLLYVYWQWSNLTVVLKIHFHKTEQQRYIQNWKSTQNNDIRKITNMKYIIIMKNKNKIKNQGEKEKRTVMGIEVGVPPGINMISRSELIPLDLVWEHPHSFSTGCFCCFRLKFSQLIKTEIESENKLKMNGGKGGRQSLPSPVSLPAQLSRNLIPTLSLR